MRAIKKEIKTTTVSTETLIRKDGVSTIHINPTKVLIGNKSDGELMYELAELYGMGTIVTELVQTTANYTMDIETFLLHATIQPITTETEEN